MDTGQAAKKIHGPRPPVAEEGHPRATQILRQITQLTAVKHTRAQTHEMRQGGVTGVEFILENAISDAQGLDTSLFDPLDHFRAAHPEVPVVALGLTCELFDLERFAAKVQPVLAACAARGVQHLNLAVLPAPGAARLDYAEGTHVVYTALRDLRDGIESSGALLNLEAGRHGLFLSPLEMRQMIDAINSWAIGACVDAPKISTFSRPADWIATLGRRLKALRRSEGDPAPTQLDALIIVQDE